jgi:hypothetical protein
LRRRAYSNPLFRHLTKSIPPPSVFNYLYWKRGFFELRRLLIILLLSAAALSSVKTGPPVGAIIPRFELPDQHGELRDFRSIAGPKGAMLVFFRSADW